MLTETILASLAAVVFDHLLGVSGVDQRLRDWLTGRAVQLAFQRAFAQAYSSFSEQFPDLRAELFDESFLRLEAGPEIRKFFIPGQWPDPHA